MLSGENFQKFVRRRRLRNSNRSSILCAARSSGFAPAGYNRLSTGPELSFTRTLGGRHSLPKRFVRSARSVRRIRISNMISEPASAVGATNQTTLKDYAKAIGPNAALILKVHRSNFFMSGFVESTSSAAIAALARKTRVPFVEDLGSGAVIPTEQFGIAEHEPTPAE